MEWNDQLRLKIILTDEELQFPAIDELLRKFKEWSAISKENEGRKTRAANRRPDALYDEIMSFKIPPIKIDTNICDSIQPSTVTAHHSVDSSEGSEPELPITRSLRSRSRTPVKRPQTATTPCTPRNQRIRQKQPPSVGSSNSGSSSVLNAALNQQHPSVSVTKIRQLLRADSAQKKRNEEKERQERLAQDRKAKEERAEAQKKQLLEARAVNAKLKREQRILHAAEVRKAREETRRLQKLREQESKRAAEVAAASKPVEPESPEPKSVPAPPPVPVPILKTKPAPETESVKKPEQVEPKFKNLDLNSTFKKPADDVDNIDISCQDETTEEDSQKQPVTATWARAPYIRDALLKQFTKPDAERAKEIASIFEPVRLPIDLEQIFGPAKAVHAKYLCRTSSAVWTPPHLKSVKRSRTCLESESDSR